MKMQLYRGFSAALCAVFVSFLPGVPAAAAQPAASVVEVSDLGAVSDAPFYIGIEKGYFADQNIKINFTKFDSAAQTIAPLATNRLHVAGGGASVGFFNAMGQDWPIRIVMARTRDVPGFSTDTMMLRSDLRDQIKSFADLKGRKIASTAPGSIFDFMLAKILGTAGLKPGDVTMAFMSFSDMAVALQAKAVDAAMVTEPFAARYTENGLAFPFTRAADVIKDPPMEVGFILYSKAWADQNPDQARGFTVAYLHGLRDYYDAMKGGVKRLDVIDTLTKYTTLKDKAIYDRIAWSYMDPNAQISVASLNEQQDWYASLGSVKKKVPVEAVIDTSFLDYALTKVGRVSDK
jgi:NitT/TauT family transport system substrate-binding protein